LRVRGRSGRRPLNLEKAQSRLLLVKGGLSHTEAARHTGFSRSTPYREIQARDRCLSH
jgi:hypothetical protein